MEQGWQSIYRSGVPRAGVTGREWVGRKSGGRNGPEQEAGTD